MHGPSFLSFHFLSFSISFPKLTMFTILRLYMACKMWNLRDIELQSGRKISAFPVYFFLYNWIGEHEITKLKKNICLESRKKETKTQKDRNDYLIFSAMRTRKRHLFCTSSHHNVPYEKQQELNKGSGP